MNRPATRPHSDGAYAPDAFLQWWYFDAMLASGHRFLTFFLPRFEGSIEDNEPGLPMVDIVIRRPDGATVRDRRFFRPGEVAASTNNVEAFFGPDCSVVYRKDAGGTGLGRYLLKARAERIAYDLILEPEIPPWAPTGGIGRFPRPLIMLLRRTLFTRDWFHYVPFVPRGRLQGSIVVDGEALDARGTAYHEQGRLNFCLGDFVPVWYWMHVEHPPWTILSGSADPPAGLPRPRGGTRGGIGWVQKGDRCLLAAFDVPGFRVRWPRVWRRDPAGREEQSMAWEAGVRLQRPGLRVTAEMVSRDVLTIVPFRYPARTDAKPFWGQTVADVEVEIREGPEKTRFRCEGLLETMVTGA